MLIGAVARTGAYFGAGSGTIWLDNVQCNAHKITLASCSKACYGCHNCNHNEDAGVECPRKIGCSCVLKSMINSLIYSML